VSRRLKEKVHSLDPCIVKVNLNYKHQCPCCGELFDGAIWLWEHLMCWCKGKKGLQNENNSND